VTAPTPLVDDDDTDVGPPTDDAGTASQDGDGPTDPTPLVQRVLGWWPLALAVLIPLVLFVPRALGSPINFDGGMNLQVAERLADGQGYTRFYNELRIFPHEVQTNGPFIYLAAAAIKVFGPNQFAFQFANLVFIAAFSVVIYAMLRDHKVLRVLGPILVLLAMPAASLYGLGGLGEVPVSFFMFGSVLFLVEAIRRPERAPWWVAAAAASFGGAVTTKTFATGAIPPLAVGGLCVLVAAPTRKLRLQIIAAGAAVALLPVIREVHKYFATGSASAWRAWWADERQSISKQAGFESERAAGPIQRFLDHMHVLSGQVYFSAEVLIFALFIPMAWVAGVLLWRWRTRGLKATLVDPASALLLIVGTFAATYVGWWMLFVPENKLWIRRIIPGLLAVQLLYVLMVGWLVPVARDAVRRARNQAVEATPAEIEANGNGNGATSAPAAAPASGFPALVGRWGPAVALVAGLAVLSVTALPYAFRKVEGNTRSLLKDQQAWLDANDEAADYIRDHPDDVFYGDEWWSAPTVSLMAGTDFYNVGVADFCALDPVRDRLVWDLDARNIRSAEPWTRDDALAYEKLEAYGDFVTIYSVGPGPNANCDAPAGGDTAARDQAQPGAESGTGA
jgi:hypothetical protein